MNTIFPTGGHRFLLSPLGLELPEVESELLALKNIAVSPAGLSGAGSDGSYEKRKKRERRERKVVSIFSPSPVSLSLSQQFHFIQSQDENGVPKGRDSIHPIGSKK